MNDPAVASATKRRLIDLVLIGLISSFPTWGVAAWAMNAKIRQEIALHDRDPLAHATIRETLPTRDEMSDFKRIHEEILHRLNETNERLARIEGALGKER